MIEARAELNYRGLWLAFGWLLIGAVVYLSLTTQPIQMLDFDHADKLDHSIAYATLMAWFCQLYWRAGQRMKLFMAFAAMGIALEFVQGMLGYRTFDYFDMLANVVGVLAGWLLVKTRIRRSLAAFDRCVSAAAAR